LLVPRSSSTSVAAWTWPTWVVSQRRVLEAVFVLLVSLSPWRRIFIGSHSLPPLWFVVTVLQQVAGVQHHMEVLQLSVSKRRLNNSSSISRSSKLRSRSIDNSRKRSPGKLRISSSCNLRISNKRNSSLSNSRSVNNSRRSPGKLRLSSSCNMRISNR
jgi:hypothetical protein